MKQRISKTGVPTDTKLPLKERDQIAARDLEIINRNADSLNAEAEEVLRYQAPIDRDE